MCRLGCMPLRAVVFLILTPSLLIPVDRTNREAGSSALSAMWPFLGWAAFTAAAQGVGKYGVQNLAVYVILIAGSALIARSPGRAGLLRIVRLLSWLLAGLYALSLALNGLGSGLIFGARSFAIEALPLLGAAIAAPRTGRTSPFLPWLLFVLIILSLSRTAMLAGFVLMVVYCARAGNRGGVVKMLLTLLVLSSAAFLTATHVHAIRDRFTQGDRAFSVGGLTLDTEGRNVIWPLVWDSAKQHPWIGQGPGSSTVLVEKNLPPETEPHNDYLRLWHDFGLVGLALWIGGFAAAVFRCLRGARVSGGVGGRSHEMAAAMALIAVGIVMFTDNAIIYPFAMAPLALVVGAAAPSISVPSTRVARSGRQERGVPTSKDSAGNALEIASRAVRTTPMRTSTTA
jgi:O-antigen ligase